MQNCEKIDSDLYNLQLKLVQKNHPQYNFASITSHNDVPNFPSCKKCSKTIFWMKVSGIRGLE